MNPLPHSYLQLAVATDESTDLVALRPALPQAHDLTLLVVDDVLVILAERLRVRKRMHSYGVLGLVEDEVRLQLLRVVRGTVGVTTIRRQQILDLLALVLLTHEATFPGPPTNFFSRSMLFLNSFRSALEVSSDPFPNFFLRAYVEHTREALQPSTSCPPRLTLHVTIAALRLPLDTLSPLANLLYTLSAITQNQRPSH